MYGKVSDACFSYKGMFSLVPHPNSLMGTGSSKSWTELSISPISHGHDYFCNTLMYDSSLGYLQLQQSNEILEVDRLSNLSPDSLPEGSKYLFEINTILFVIAL